MKNLKLEVRKNSSVYNQIERTEKKAIYSQKMQNDIIGYEVFYIAKHNGYVLAGSEIEASETYPCNEAFGVTAWSFSNLNMALNKYKSL